MFFRFWYSVIKLLAKFQCGIDLCLMLRYDFSNIMLQFLSYLNVPIENISTASKTIVGNNGCSLYLVVISY